MVDQGGRAEVERLLARGLSPSLPVMRAIGVAQIGGWLAGAWSREDAIVQGAQATRNYAKRQFTWFRRQPPADWLRTDDCNHRTNFAILLRHLVVDLIFNFS